MNIIKIAELAGVSKSTVSRYLNDGAVSASASDKIKKVIEETGFTPLRHAQIMRTNKTKLIGVIVPKISTETAALVIEGITEITSTFDYEVLIANTNLSIEKEINYLKIFKSNYVDGIIFMATVLTAQHKQLMKELQVPIVVVAQKVEDFPSVSNNDYEASKEIVNFLINKGHNQIGFIGVSEQDVAVGVERKRGYMDALKEHELPLQLDAIKIGDFSIQSGYNLAKEIMSSDRVPSAIFAVTDHLAIGAMQYLNEFHYKIPEDIAIVGIGDSKSGNLITPKLTTIQYPYHQLGAKSAEMIMNQIITGKISMVKNESNFIMNYRLINRDSV
ncbi:MAG: LacI family DNA-binding transcriptional regulator [Turicibacter sp.]